MIHEVYHHNIGRQGEAASTYIEAAGSYPENIPMIINEGGYTEQQIFYVGGTAFCWKKASLELS